MLPTGTYPHNAPHSGLVSKSVTNLGGIIDSGYHGKISAIMFNRYECEPQTSYKGNSKLEHMMEMAEFHDATMHPGI
ncbi:hypothetical protein LPJ66_003694 [Kickxella alabastrina]|uniref:Uncharacterized protein n=1 Tax=Kickxella alabastrina TaxID=61397 RepID=A0ACC1IK02_9FUNG|nr:hypothetical protein LPJ66_003694 [Kickxella alabastrina]